VNPIPQPDPERREWAASSARPQGAARDTSLPSGMPEREDFLTRLGACLLDALTKQTEAINRLAASNEMLVQAMAEDQGMDEAPVTTYLNGKSAL